MPEEAEETPAVAAEEEAADFEGDGDTAPAAETAPSAAAARGPTAAAAEDEDEEAEEATAEKGKPTEDNQPVAKEEEEEDAHAGEQKPSYTLHVKGMPEDMDVDELEPLFKRHGEVVEITKVGDKVIVKFSKTPEAFEARKRLNGFEVDGAKLSVEFGPQDPNHYNREKRGRLVARKKPDGAKTDEKKGAMRAWGEDDAPGSKREAADTAGDAAPKEGAVAFQVKEPAKAVSKWSEELSFEQQLEDFMKMPRRGMYNRYLVLGKLPPELRTGEAIWRAMHTVQRDIIQIEMLTCFGKPVAHIALRSATAAAAMHRLCEQMHPNLTVAFAPPRRASRTLWLGNVDDFVPRKHLEEMLSDFGPVPQGMRYLPARTCAFATFQNAKDAVAARNTLYGLEVQKNQYLNVDFVDDGAAGFAPAAPETVGSWQWSPQWGWYWLEAQRPAAPPHAPWAAQPPPGVRTRLSPARGQERRHRSRTRSRGRGGAASDREEESPAAAAPQPREKRRRIKKVAADRSPEPQAAQPPKKKQKLKKAAPQKHEKKLEKTGSQSEDQVKIEEKTTPPTAKVQLFKMGEFCCNVAAAYVKGKLLSDPIQGKLEIDQRTKVDHCKTHLDRAGKLATFWHFSAADRKDCAAYDALCDYFVEKERVGLVQTAKYYVYIVPPTEKYFTALGIPPSNFVVGLQIP
eukprot:CAMPEP_0206540242 /NCGR_PEP_ID=MMETSP0325_2-20121206/8873_1 /ASSEMBLY_ACC=CAM_ASM_000347 /TAXON_ID=2866 /ORGANISM="Crypthecodinium cohnii, Strain Seligo" /LENGTH=683 /DNA_ID=CAMNT_0054037897 /DNA_START=32 /DNA_END=2079 /DNA_ORIENTATION=-